MTEIYLARHPETTHNIDLSIVSGRSNDILLTERGVEQARDFATAFSLNYPVPDILFTSPAIRTKTLLDIYLQRTGLDKTYIIDDSLQEMSQGIAEGKDPTTIYTPDVLERIDTELFDFKLPEGESLNEVADRMLDWVWRTHYQFPDKKILAATHGQAIRALIGHLIGWDHYQTTRDPANATPNVSLTHLSVTDRTITLHQFAKEPEAIYAQG